MLKQRSWLKYVTRLVITGMVAINSMAYLQANALTHFAPEGRPPIQPESMSLLHKARVMITGVTIPKPRNTHSPRDLGLPFETRTITLTHDASLEAWYIPSAHARGLVAMFHSYAASKESLLHPAKALHDLGYNTLLVDFRGAGGSTGYDTMLGVREADDVVATVDYIRQQWPQQPLILYGVSMGSTAILRAIAHEHIQPSAVILESPFDRLTQTTRHRFEALGLPAFPASELLLFWGSVQQGFNAFSHNPVAYAPAVTCPTLLLYGADDPRVTEGETQTIFAQLAGPKTLVRVPQAGHELLQLAAPDLWTEHVSAFLTQHATQ